MRSLLPLATAMVALVSCAGPMGSTASMRGPSDATAPPASPTPAATDEPAEAPPELRFTEPRLGGGTVRGADLAGNDLVMWFWAPW